MSATKPSGEISTHKSFCRFCHACCAIDVDVADGKVVKVRGDRGNSMFRGYTCIKGRELPAQHNHPDRLRSSLRRKGDEFEEISSEQALDEIAERVQAIIDEKLILEECRRLGLDNNAEFRDLVQRELECLRRRSTVTPRQRGGPTPAH